MTTQKNLCVAQAPAHVGPSSVTPLDLLAYVETGTNS